MANSAEPASPHQGSSCHVWHFPMWVIATTEVLKMRGPPEMHEHLLERGQLFEHQPDFYTIFISHQWRGRHHPDPDGAQLAVLQKSLQGIMDGRLPKEADLVTQFHMGKKEISRKQRNSLKSGFAWMDWFCVPQDSASTHLLLKAIRSIPAYVEQLDGSQTESDFWNTGSGGWQIILE